MILNKKFIKKYFLWPFLATLFLGACVLTTAGANTHKTLYLQVAAYSRANQATNFSNRLKTLTKYQTRIKKRKAKNRIIYEVQLGPFGSYKSAKAEKGSLKTKGYNSILKYYRITQLKPKMTSSRLANKASSVSNQSSYESVLSPVQTVTINKTTSQNKTKRSIPKAQTKSKPNKSSPKPKRLWNLRNVDIRNVIEEVSLETGKNFIVAPNVQGKISIIASTPIDAKEAYQMFLAAIKVLGFAAVPTGHVVKVVSNRDSIKLATPIADAKHLTSGEQIVVRVIPIKNVSAMQLVPLIRPLIPSWGNVSAYSPSNIVVIAAGANNVERLAKIIQRVDVTNTNGIDVVPLHYATAQDLVTTIKQLQTNRSVMAEPKATVATEGSSNTVLISGNASARLKMRLLISELDTPSASGTNANTKVIYLHYLKTQDLVPILAGVAQSYGAAVGTVIGTVTSTKDYSSDETSSDGTTTTAATPNTTSTTTRAVKTQSQGDTKGKPKVEIIGEPNTNSIIINAPPTLLRTLKTVISQLDIRPAQVLVEALVAEVDANISKQLGIQWGTLASSSSVGATSDDDSSSASKILQQGLGIITRKGVKSITGIITALENDRNADILSTPSVVVLDNHQAKIVVGTKLSVQSSSYPNNAEGTTTATPYTTFKQEQVALHLYVTPQISQNNTIQLSIDQGNDTLQNPENPTTTPVINISSIQTSVLINSGDVLVLGGLIQNQMSRSANKIPILGDIPIVGHLFSVDGKSREKKVLMVFLRPIIISNAQTGLKISGSKYNMIRNQELAWVKQEHDKNSLSNKILPPWGKNLKLPPPFPGL